jgi:hypothetical protein
MMRNAEKEVYGPSTPDKPNHLSNALHNGQPVVSVFRISNGFVISHSDYNRHENTLVYCKEISEIGDHIVTLQARVAMGISPSVTIGASGSLTGGMAKVAQQFQYPRS